MGVCQFSNNKLELIFNSVECRSFQVVLHFPGQHQTGVFHWCIVKQPIQVCHLPVGNTEVVFHFLAVNGENRAIGKGNFYRIGIHVVETMQRLYHSHLDEAQELVQELQGELRQFKTELADIQISANMQVNIDGFLRFADYFFDGLFADWAVGDKISQSMNSVSSTKSQINQMLDKLGNLERATDSEITSMKAQLNDLIVKT